MPSVIELILLASSSKNRERCIAGIDRKTGAWIRPVGSMGEGEVPFKLRQIDGKEPEVLDIVEMTLSDSAETHGFQTENRHIIASPWKKIGKAVVEDIRRYCSEDHFVLFDAHTEIKHSDILNDPTRRSSLQLWSVHDFTCHEDCSITGMKRWRGVFSIPSGERLSLVIKDIEYEEMLNQGHTPSADILLLISLGVPYQPQTRKEKSCWKLIATVIEA